MKPIPERLTLAYDWINGAGQVTEFIAASHGEVDDYAADASANAAAHDVAIPESDFIALHLFLNRAQ